MTAPDYGLEDSAAGGRARAVEQEQRQNTAVDVQTDIPLLQPGCRQLRQHALVYAGQPLCGCRALAQQQPPADDDGGETLIAQSGGIRRDRMGRVIG